MEQIETILTEQSDALLESRLQLSNLQKQYYQLQQLLEERKQSLQMHAQQLPKKILAQQRQHHQYMLYFYLNKVNEVRSRWSDQLLNQQVAIENEQDFLIILRELQNRVQELRTMLIQKEHELMLESGSKKKHAPKRENLYAFKTYCFEEAAILRLYRQYQTLRMVAEPANSTQKNINGQNSKASDLKIMQTKEKQPQSAVFELEELKKQIKEKALNSLSKDRMLSRTIKLLLQDVKQQKSMRAQYQSYLEEQKNLDSEHQKLSATYMRILEARTAKRKSPCSQMLLTNLEKDDQFNESQSQQEGNTENKPKLNISQNKTNQQIKENTKNSKQQILRNYEENYNPNA